MTATAQGEFIVITMSVTNIGNEAQNYFGQNQKVIDANGRQYEANSAAGMWMNSGLSLMGDINPGNSNSGEDRLRYPARYAGHRAGAARLDVLRRRQRQAGLT